MINVSLQYQRLLDDQSKNIAALTNQVAKKKIEEKLAQDQLEAIQKERIEAEHNLTQAFNVYRGYIYSDPTEVIQDYWKCHGRYPIA